jgi:hypothetical protein
MTRYATALFTVALLLVAVGCGDSRPQQPGDDSDIGVIATLGSLGVTLTWVGGICSAAGIGLSLVSLFYPPLASLALLFRFAAVGGAGVLVTGSSIQFLSSYPAIMVLAIIASGAVVVWYHWADVLRFLAHRKAVKP